MQIYIPLGMTFYILSLMAFLKIKKKDGLCSRIKIIPMRHFYVGPLEDPVVLSILSDLLNIGYRPHRFGKVTCRKYIRFYPIGLIFFVLFRRKGREKNTRGTSKCCSDCSGFGGLRSSGYLKISRVSRNIQGTSYYISTYRFLLFFFYIHVYYVYNNTTY